MSQNRPNAMVAIESVSAMRFSDDDAPAFYGGIPQAERCFAFQA
jgi:hypothetical protein